jgi:hypothetical protein
MPRPDNIAPPQDPTRWRTQLNWLRRYFASEGEVKVKRAGRWRLSIVNPIVFPPFATLCRASILREGNGTMAVALRLSAGHHAARFSLTPRREKAIVHRVSRRRRVARSGSEALQPHGTGRSALNGRRFGNISWAGH